MSLPPLRVVSVKCARITQAWWDAPDVCPLCRRGGHATHGIKGTDRKVCGDCMQDRPVELILGEVTT